jgi:dinuclear metal center YbgI/SA1388 family protein
MKIKEISRFLEGIAPLALQESYDNAGLLTGDPEKECTGVLVTLDVTEAVILEAIKKNCNLVVAHHPLIFKGLKKLTGKNYVERTVIASIKNDIAIYAIHTNLDNLVSGVNKKLADKIGLTNCQVLSPKSGTLKKLVTFVPNKNVENLQNGLFKAGAGAIGNYNECSFMLEGKGTFTAQEGSNPYVGNIGERHFENETRIEVVFPGWLQPKIITALYENHPYEEVAFDIYSLDNSRKDIGSGLTGNLPEEIPEKEFLQLLKDQFGLKVIRHTGLTGKNIKKVALCGGAGFFLLPDAIASGSDVYVTSDVKYHEFFDADQQILLADIGHYESEQFTTDLLAEFLQEKYANFAILKTEINTNPVNYFT